MNQIARNLTDAVDGLLKGKGYLIHDRDPLFMAEFLSTLAEAGTSPSDCHPRSPNLNCYAERFVRSIKEACLDRMILFGEDSLRTAVREFTVHYHSERNHQGIGNLLIFPANNSPAAPDLFKPAAVSAECSITMSGQRDQMPAHFSFRILRGPGAEQA